MIILKPCQRGFVSNPNQVGLLAKPNQDVTKFHRNLLCLPVTKETSKSATSEKKSLF